MTDYFQQNRCVRIMATAALLFQQLLFAPLSQRGAVYAQDGAAVVAGQAQIIQNGLVTNINSQTDRAIINWNTFNIPQGYTTNFNQPGANSAVLNRVITPNNPSAIFGTLNSNGNVFLVNPSGIVVGPSGVINTNGFTASVLDIANDEFMRGGVLNFRGDSRAQILNQGRIITGAGGTTLIGGEVINQGLIESDGQINLLTGGSVHLRDGGIYTQADQATVLNGISETSGLIKNDGTIRATGALEVDGEVYLVSPGGTVMQEALIAARSKNGYGGNVVVDAGAGTATVTGEIDVQGETGGSVTVTGNEVNLTGAEINASGVNGGGNINIGGGFQGNDPSIRNAQNTFIDTDSLITADALQTGDGGTVIIWSDGSTDYFGSVINRGSSIGQGGFTEVSGKQNLRYAGSVNTGGGQLLLDPTNFTINAGTGALTTSSIGADTLVTELGSNNVTLQTDAAGVEDGDITVNANVLYDSTHSLTLLAHGDVTFNASVQNRNATGGDINIVAGWDGTTAFNATNFLNADVNNTTLFGTNNGSVFVGSGTQLNGVAVGSRSGNTNVFANNLNISGSSGRDNAFAQLGFVAADQGATFEVIGGINARLTGGLNALAGANNAAHAQLGHGNGLNRTATIDATVNAPITIATVGDITFTGNGYESYSQLGHGGLNYEGQLNGDIRILQAGAIRFTSGGLSSVFAHAQLGHGGYQANGNKGGNLTLTQTGDIVFAGTASVLMYVQLGHGGYESTGNITGNISVSQAGNIDFQVGNGFGYVQLGHGGSRSTGTKMGSLTFDQVENLIFTANGSYAQLGNGGERSAGSTSGLISISNADNLTFSSGIGEYNYAQLGHGGVLINTSDHNGDIILTQVGNLTFNSALSADNYAYSKLGNGSPNGSGNNSGNISITDAGHLSLIGGFAFATDSQLGHGGTRSDGNSMGNITLNRVGDILLDGSNGGGVLVQIGHGGRSSTGSQSGTIDITTSGDLTLTAFLGRNEAVIGHGDEPDSIGSDNLVAGNINLRVGGAASLTNSFIGHTIGDTGTYTSGNTFLGVRGDLTANATSQFFSAAPAQNGELRFYVAGNDNVNTATLLNGTAHGGTPFPNNQGNFGFGTGPYTADPANDGNFAYYNQPNDIFNYTIDATEAANIVAALAGGDVQLATNLDQANFGAEFDWDAGTQFITVNSAILYDANQQLDFAATGDITFHASVQNRNLTGGDINIVAGWDGTSGFASPFNPTNFLNADVSNTTLFGNNNGSVFIGNGTQTSGVAVGSRHGNTNVFANNLNLTGSNSAFNAHAQLGFYDINGQGFAANSTITSGDIHVLATGSVVARSGLFYNSYVQIGHGGNRAVTGGVQSTAWNYSGDITLEGQENVTFSALGSSNSYAQLGNGGLFARGSHSGNHAITAGQDITFQGNDFFSYAQLGNGAVVTSGSHSGNHTINAGRNISFLAGNALGYVQLGNGGYAASGSHSGNHTVTAGQDISFLAGNGNQAYAQLGNGGIATPGNHSGNITITTARNITFQAGSGFAAYSQLGNGGFAVDGNHSGEIDVTSTGNLSLTGRDASVQRQYAVIGNGDELGDGDTGNTVAGNINLRVGGNAGVSNGFIGNLIDADGTYTNGNTFLGVRGDLTADAGSRFFSAAPAQNGELRFYVAGNDNVNTATLLNGTAHGGTAFPNNQGNFGFGEGPYTANPATDGNFAYYALADIFNYTIDNTEAANIVAALAGGDVQLATNLDQANFGAEYDWDGGTQFISVNSAILYDANQQLDFAATGDITFNASVQNRNTTGGDINIVAGWDGTSGFASPFNPTNFLAANVSSTTLFGNDNSPEHTGSVFIGDGTQTTNIAVGSRNGRTAVFGHDLRITGSSVALVEGYAMLGFRVRDGIALDGTDLDHSSPDGANVPVNGPIDVRTVGDIVANAGTIRSSNAQIGHVGFDPIFATVVEAAVNADITVAAGGDILFTALGQPFDIAYAQLGHGGLWATGDHQGAITIMQARDITFTGGNNVSYAQIGHGGVGAGGNQSGAITISKSRNLSLQAGPAAGYAQVGHGGKGQNLLSSDFGAKSGSIDITLDGNLVIAAQNTSFNKYAVIGHGDNLDGADNASQSVAGNINLRVGGNASVTNGFIGHLIDNGGTYTSGNTLIGVRGDLTANATSQFFSAAPANNGELRFYVAGNDNVNTATLLNGTAHGGTAFPNNQGNFGFGDGPYTANPATDGNFAYYALADVFNYTIDATEAANIVAALSGGDVQLATNLDQANFGAEYDWDGGTQFINVNSAILYDANQQLDFAATGDITFNASVQNRNITGGDINIVAGWDGTSGFASPFNPTNFLNADVSNTTLFGNNNGSVFIGNGTQMAGIAIGSRHGNTNVFSHDLKLRGSDTNLAYAQIGFHDVTGQGLVADLEITSGNIKVLATGNVLAQAGSQGGNTSGLTTSHVQIGHGGNRRESSNFTAWNYSGDISLSVRSDINFLAGSGDLTYAQLGNGGSSADGNHSGNQTISTARDITFAAGDGNAAYAQLGNGGAFSDGSHSGDQTISTARDITFTAGDVFNAYAQLGNGGLGADGSHIGNHTIITANDITFTAATGTYAYAQLGNGGVFADGNQSGNHMISTANNITFTAGDGTNAYAQLGNGGGFADGSHSGNLGVTSTGNLLLTGTNTTTQYALIGNGDQPGDGDAGNTVAGNINVRVGGAVSLTNAFIGHIIGDSGSYISGNTFLGVRSDLTADAGSRFFSAAPAQSGELRFYVAGDDNVNTATLLNGTAHGGTAFPNNQGNFGFGDGPYTANPATDGNFAYYALADIYNYTIDATEAANIVAALSGGDVQLATNLDQANFGAEYDWDGGTQFIDVNSAILYDANQQLDFAATGDITFHASVQNRNATGGDINIVAGWDGTTPFNATDFLAADVSSTTLFGNDSSSEHTGSVLIEYNSGLGGVAVGSRHGNTNVFAHDVTLLASGPSRAVYTQLGFYDINGQGLATNSTITSGDINVLATGNVVADARDVIFHNVQIGHGGNRNSNNGMIWSYSGDINLNVNESVTFSAGTTAFNYAQLGNGGVWARGNHSGNHTIAAGQDISFLARSGFESYARLGNGGSFAFGNHSGNMTITTARDITFQGGTNNNSYAQLGNGGYFAAGNHSGNHTITNARNISFQSGTGNITYSQLGNGGYLTGAFSDTHHSGEIDLTLTGNLTLTGQDTIDQYALIGNGAELGDTSAGNTVAGNINLRVGGNADVANGFIGNLINSEGTYTSGNTYIAVGNENFESTNTTNSLMMDANSQLSSASNANSGQLRIYLPNEASFQAANGAKLNGVDVATFTSGIPNIEGGFDPFLGTYTPNQTIGNFAFYFALIDLIVNANSGSSTYGDVPVNPGLDLASGTLLTGDTLASIGLTNNFNLTKSSDAGMYILTVDASSLNNRYNLESTTNGTFTINKADLTITPTAQSKTYGDLFAFTGSEFTTLGLKDDDAITTMALNSLGTPIAADAGLYDINSTSITGSTSFNAANYNITFGTLIDGFTVNKADLTITPTAQSKTYGDLFAFTGSEFTTLGLKDDDAITTVALNSLGTPVPADAGLYDINSTAITGSTSFNAANYNITFGTLVDGFTVNKADLTITPTTQSKTYGDLFAFTGSEFTTLGLKDDDAITSVALNSLGTPIAADAGLYDINSTAITGSTSFNATNYNITFGTLVDGFTVNKADLTITADNFQKQQGTLGVLDGLTGFTTSPLRNGETVTQVTLDSPGMPVDAPVGVYPLTVTDPIGTFNPDNYNITLVDGIYEVFVRNFAGPLTPENGTYDLLFRYQEYFNTINSLNPPAGPGGFNFQFDPANTNQQENEGEEPEEGTIPFEIRINSLQVSN